MPGENFAGHLSALRIVDSGRGACYNRRNRKKGRTRSGNVRMKIEISKLFDLKHTLAAELFSGKVYPWEVLPEIREFILKIGSELPADEYEEVQKNIWVAKDASIAQTACLNGPLIVDHGAEIRHCAYIRGSVIVGKNVVVGNSTELKNCVLFDGVQVPHFNYVGDSILGYLAHMGAGAVTSNVRSDKKRIIVHSEEEIETGLRKLGAMLGDRAEIGCNSVLNPGTVIGRDCIVYPAACVRGMLPENHIWKTGGKIAERKSESE